MRQVSSPERSRTRVEQWLRFELPVQIFPARERVDVHAAKLFLAVLGEYETILVEPQEHLTPATRYGQPPLLIDRMVVPADEQAHGFSVGRSSRLSPPPVPHSLLPFPTAAPV